MEWWEGYLLRAAGCGDVICAPDRGFQNPATCAVQDGDLPEKEGGSQ